MAHTTKHGNRYSNQEWSEMQAHFVEEETENEAFFAKLAGMEKYLKRQLNEMDISQAGINALAQAFTNGTYDPKNYQFTNGREEKVNELWNRWNKALN